MIKLSYSTNGLTALDLTSAIDAVAKAGYSGIELSFDTTQFNPFLLTTRELVTLKEYLQKCHIQPASIATPTISFLTDRPHEPSIMCVDLAGRKQRIDLIKRGIHIAKILGAPIVSFGSGFIRDDHISNPTIDPRKLLITSITACLEEIDDNIVLVIEPEPGMYIETLAEGIELVQEINSPNFKLHLDLCHVFCTEHDYLAALAQAAPYTKYLHLSDTTAGYNLKLQTITPEFRPDFNFASYLLYFPQSCDFLFIDRQRALYFYDKKLTPAAQQELKKLVVSLNGSTELELIAYNSLYRGPSPYDAEINTYIVSVPKLSFYVLDRAKPIIKYLRGVANNTPIIDKMVANTLTGKVHFHTIPGTGEIDFKSCFTTLTNNGFTGYGAVELYHHIDNWQEAVTASFHHLSNCLPNQN